MKILLIDPPFKAFTGYANNFFPIGLAILAAILKNEGHEVKVLEVDKITMTNDINYSDEYKRLRLYVDGINDESHPVWAEIRKRLDDFRPDLIGITIMTQKFGSAIKTAEICKKWNKNVPIVVGGPHATLDPDQTLQSGPIDYVVREEGEDILPKLVKALEEKRDFESVGSLSYIKNGRVVHNLAAPLIQNLDTVPFPARDLLMNPGNYSSEDMGVIMTARGCPYKCTYCFHMLAKLLRVRSTGNVIEEIKAVKEKYGTKQFAFKDDTFTINRKRLTELLDKMIDQKLNINW
ncbi:MAG: radical SAM protein, partial [Candidatus Margulisiibacteriota bacterium]